LQTVEKLLDGAEKVDFAKRSFTRGLSNGRVKFVFYALWENIGSFYFRGLISKMPQHPAGDIGEL